MLDALRELRCFFCRRLLCEVALGSPDAKATIKIVCRRCKKENTITLP